MPKYSLKLGNISKFKVVGTSLLDVFFPRFCIGCKAVVQEEYLKFICQACVSSLNICSGTLCEICGAFLAEGLGQTCPCCQNINPVFEESRSLFWMRGIASNLIHTIKYHKGLFLLKDLGHILSQYPNLIEFLSNSVLVPVPLHPLKELKRSFNQSYYIAKQIQQLAYNISIHTVLKRVKYTSSQTTLGPDHRQRNVKNAFALSPKVTIHSALRYIIIDDVFTTGFTVNACSQVLQMAGAKHIGVFTLGHS